MESTVPQFIEHSGEAGAETKAVFGSQWLTMNAHTLKKEV